MRLIGVNLLARARGANQHQGERGMKLCEGILRCASFVGLTASPTG